MNSFLYSFSADVGCLAAQAPFPCDRVRFLNLLHSGPWMQ
jgi:hypothetical protein